MANILGAKQLDRIFAEISKQSDRGATIVATSLLEQFMERAILRYFRDDLPTTTRQTLFEGVGPLATFSSKIHLAFAMGIITEQAYADLRTINRIRNIFAHDTAPHRFSSDEIATRVASLHGRKGLINPPRGKNSKLRAEFLGTVLLHSLAFISAEKGDAPEDNDPLALLASLDKSRQPPRFLDPLQDKSSGVRARRRRSSRG